MNQLAGEKAFFSIIIDKSISNVFSLHFPTLSTKYKRSLYLCCQIKFWLDPNQMTKVNIANNGTNQYFWFLVCYAEKDTISLLWHSWTKMYNLNLIIRKHKTNPNWGIFYKMIGLYNFKNVKTKKSWETVPH